MERGRRPRGHGLRSRLWENPEATHEAERRLTYILRLAANNERLQVVGEKLENISPYESFQSRPYYYFAVENGYGAEFRPASRTAMEVTTIRENPLTGFSRGIILHQRSQ